MGVENNYARLNFNLIGFYSDKAQKKGLRYAIWDSHFLGRGGYSIVYGITARYKICPTTAQLIKSKQPRVLKNARKKCFVDFVAEEELAGRHPDIHAHYPCEFSGKAYTEQR